MGSDHRCVMAKFEIPKAKKKSRRNKAPLNYCERDTCGDEHELMYRDFEQKVKEAEPKKTKKITGKETTEAEARILAQMATAAEAAARAATTASTAAADGKSITKSYAVAAEATEASIGSAGNKRKRQCNSGSLT